MIDIETAAVILGSQAVTWGFLYAQGIETQKLKDKLETLLLLCPKCKTRY